MHSLIRLWYSKYHRIELNFELFQYLGQNMSLAYLALRCVIDLTSALHAITIC